MPGEVAFNDIVAEQLGQVAFLRPPDSAGRSRSFRQRPCTGSGPGSFAFRV